MTENESEQQTEPSKTVEETRTVEETTRTEKVNPSQASSKRAGGLPPGVDVKA